MFSNKVSFNKDYFKNTIREYNDFLYAFFRETAQNCVDAFASEVHYFISTNENGSIQVICDDNGSGMTEDILINKFLHLGGSYKENDSSVGGFGYAKSIILFCHDYYNVQTNDIEITGSFGTYSDVKTIQKRVGTRITVNFDSKYKEDELKEKLISWVANADIPQTQFYLNNKLLTQANNKLEFTQDLDIGSVHFSDIQIDYSTIFVRLRGMPMFKKIIYNESSNSFIGYLDLNAQSSLDCLTSNRDGLTMKYDLSFNRIINELVNERSKYKINNVDDIILNKTEQQIMYHEYKSSSSRNIKAINNSAFEKLHNAYEDRLKAMSNRLDKINNENFCNDFLIKINKNSKDSANKQFSFIIKEMNKKRNVLLANKWINTNKQVMDTLIAYDIEHSIFGFRKENEKYYYQDREIRFGFCFSDSEYGLNFKPHDDNCIYILLNPILCHSKKFTFDSFLHLVIHELSHCVVSYHSDYFESTFFEISILVNNHKKDFKNLK